MERQDGRLGTRGTTECRGCGHQGLESVLDLGRQPLANELLPTAESTAEEFPLHLRVCPDCGLGQVGEFVLPERIFGDYPYLSSMSTSWVAHTRAYARGAVERLGLAEGAFVAEIASNDGCLLHGFADRGMRVVGVEPAANVAAIARSGGIPTINAFFGSDTAADLVADHGHPALIAANNVLAHVPDMADFIAGLAIMAGPGTVITVENPSFVGLLQLGHFDTIYHEHYSYLSAHAVSRALARAGLELFDIELLPTHGGSYRYWIAPGGQRPATGAVARAIAAELDGGLLDVGAHDRFAKRCRETIAGLSDWLAARRAAGRTVVGYGAAAKGNTLLNAARIGPGGLRVVADASPEKQGKFLPGTSVPIVAPDRLSAYGPDDVLLLPWNIQTEVAQILPQVAPGADGWVAVPEMHRFHP